MALQHLRSSTANKRPTATSLADGQIAINTNAASPGIFFTNSSNVLTKVGPIQIGTSAPNSSPAGSSGNAVGEQWLDTSGSTVVLKVWDGSAWQQQNQFGAVTGSAAAPSYSFSGDSNTGIYSPGADQVAISTNGTQRLLIEADGDINIDSGGVFYDATNNRLAVGTTSPAEALHVAGNAQIGAANASTCYVEIGKGATGDRSAFIDFTGDTTYTDYGLRVIRLGGANGNSQIEHRGTGELVLNGLDTGPIVFKHLASERARIDSSGRLLVGTSSSSVAFRGIFQGNSAGTDPGAICIAFDSSTPANGSLLGALDFSDNSHVRAARIGCERDGGTWTSGSSGSQPSRLVFSTTADGAASPTERMRIGSNGFLKASNYAGYANTAASYHEFNSNIGGSYATYIRNVSSNPYGLYINYTGTSPDNNTNTFIVAQDSTTIRFVVYSDGDVRNHDGVYGAISDEKLKQDIVDAGSQWDDLKNLRVRKFKFKSDVEAYGDEAKTLIGVVAQEVETVSPGLVKNNPDKDAENNDLGTTTKSVSYSVLYMKAVKALQEAMERIETLEAKVAALEAS